MADQLGSFVSWLAEHGRDDDRHMIDRMLAEDGPEFVTHLLGLVPVERRAVDDHVVRGYAEPRMRDAWQ